MITQVTHVTRYVRDEDATLKFYLEVLGFELHTDTGMQGGGRWLTVNVPGNKHFEVVLSNPITWLKGEQQAEALRQIGHQAMLVLATSDIEELHAKLEAAGAKINPRGISDMPWGRDMTFHDLEGNEIYVVQPPQG